MTRAPADFVLALHSHLPWVLNHGRWPHGSDWLCEAAIDTYLPLLEELRALRRDGVPAPLTLGITPILANQLASPEFSRELEAYFAQRMETCAEAAASLRSTGDASLIPLVDFWRGHFEKLRTLFRSLEGGLVGAFGELAAGGTIELMSCAATHGFLPLLSRDASIRLQLRLGWSEHRRLFQRDPSGVWLPECAYRPRGPWSPLPGAPHVGPRPGIEEYVAEAGFNYFFTDAHLARAGRSYSIYGAPGAAPPNVPGPNSPYQAYRVLQRRSGQTVATLVRDPVASRQVWSRQEGYPGDEWYLEFHKIRWPGGLKYWRVSAPGSDLGSKAPYDPQRAIGQAEQHAAHFAHLLETISGSTGRAVDPARPARPPTLIAVPFDTELFGHWWFEGIHFLASVYRHLVDNPRVHPSTASEHLAIHPPRRGIQLSPGSWGNNGDFSMWLNEGTRWTWPRLWAIEAAFWDRAPEALGDPARREILAQAARAMLLAQASDWQFIMTTGQVTDYAVRRFSGHCEEAEFLLGALAPGGDLSAAATRAQALWQRDHCFPDILTTVKEVLSAEGEIS